MGEETKSMETKMNAQEFAAMLNGREYRKEITREEAVAAKNSGLVIVFGANDDLMEFNGAIDDEVGCYEGADVYVTPNGLPNNKCHDGNCPYFAAERDGATVIEALWDHEGYSWTYTTEIPHSTFDILEDGEKYCRGIVFALSDIPTPTEAKPG